MKIAIVTDSTADVPDELCQQYHIHVVPNLIIIEGRSLEDGIDITREEFYRRLPGMKNFPTTSTASTGTFLKLYEKLFHEGARLILSIHAPSTLSGIFNAASTAAQVFNDKVKVVDSGQLSLGLGFQVLAAAEAVLGGATLNAALRACEAIQPRVRVVAMLDTLEYVRRSGRVSWARARIGELLQVKPLIELKVGRVLSLGETRTRRKGIERLHQMILELGTLERLAILHTNAEADARHFLDNLHLDLPIAPLVINVTTAIGTHVGPNGLGFAAVVK